MSGPLRASWRTTATDEDARRAEASIGDVNESAALASLVTGITADSEGAAPGILKRSLRSQLWNGAVNGSTIITTNQIETMLLRRKDTVESLGRASIKMSARK